MVTAYQTVQFQGLACLIIGARNQYTCRSNEGIRPFANESILEAFGICKLQSLPEGLAPIFLVQNSTNSSFYDGADAISHCAFSNGPNEISGRIRIPCNWSIDCSNHGAMCCKT